MKEKIIEIIERIGDDYWDNYSETDSPSLSVAETAAVYKCHSNIADEILELIKTK